MKKTEDSFDYLDFEKDALERLKQGAPISGKDGIFTPLIKRILEASLEGELTAHLDEDQEINRRNGKGFKTVKTSLGNIDIDTPRDRNSTFEPQLIKKRQRVLNEEIDNKIISMYGLGLSYGDIRTHLLEMYGLEISKGTLSAVTDQVIDEVQQWQNRPLESIYPIVWMDAVHFKVKESGRIVNKAVYCVIGVNREGIKDLLGMYLGQSEGASFWLGVLTDLRERGMQDIFIACIDNLKGFAEAIETSFPDTDVQLCIVHQVRNTMRYVPNKQSKIVVTDMKEIYKAPNLEASEQALERFSEKWGKKYPHTVKSWQTNFARLTNYYKYPPEIRKLIYTTNIIENFNGRLRKVTKTKRVFSSDMALMKLLYLIQKQFVNDNWQNPRSGWKFISSQLSIIFEDRFDR